jgi:Zn ribbon nucleic-acid-binding protein
VTAFTDPFVESLETLLEFDRLTLSDEEMTSEWFLKHKDRLTDLVAEGVLAVLGEEKNRDLIYTDYGLQVISELQTHLKMGELLDAFKLPKSDVYDDGAKPDVRLPYLPPTMSELQWKEIFKIWFKMPLYHLGGMWNSFVEVLFWTFAFPVRTIGTKLVYLVRLELHRTVMLLIGGAQCPSCKLVYKFGIWRAREMNYREPIECPHCGQTIIGMEENAPFDIQ